MFGIANVVNVSRGLLLIYSEVDSSIGTCSFSLENIWRSALLQLPVSPNLRGAG